jgi:hypothetical protein
LTLFVSALLMFLVQPLIGKMLLPHLGGTAAVWNTCLVFFQAVLLIGYGYAHALTRGLAPRRQVLVQAAVVCLPFLVLPFALGDWEPPTDGNPVLALLGKLTVLVGLPFFAVSTTAPLLQRWFVHTGHPAGRDPYFLYGASNLGSIIGLALYPLVLEPFVNLTPAAGTGGLSQVQLWTAGFALFVFLVIGCALAVWKALGGSAPPVATHAAAAPAAQPASLVSAPAPASTRPGPTARAAGAKAVQAKPPAPRPGPSAAPGKAGAPADSIALRRRLRWIGLAAAPSSLMLGVTTYFTTDVAAVAFLWVLPLALYLLTFILVFARRPVVWTERPHRLVLALQPIFVLFLVFKMIGKWPAPPAIDFLLHLAAFFSTALLCHGELARDRPHARHLTEFYFWLSLGGVLGGLFNALVAPIVFQHGIWEYPLATALAFLFRPHLVKDHGALIPGDSTARRPTSFGRILDWTVPLLLGVLAFHLLAGDSALGPRHLFAPRSLTLGVLVAAAAAQWRRPLRLALAVGALFVGVGLYDRGQVRILFEGRGFFGLVRVHTHLVAHRMPKLPDADDPPPQYRIYRTLIHGGTDHGLQIIASSDEEGNVSRELTQRKRRAPITYFHERNGIAEIFHKLSWPRAQPWPAAADRIGLADARLPASTAALAGGATPAWSMLVNVQSEPPYAILGLGAGALACYAKPFQHVDFFEIDPLVKQLSVVPGYVPPWHPGRARMSVERVEPIFSFVEDAQERWARVNVILGDGRLKLKEAPASYYHLLMMDAFSSDSIPVHLLTEEAVELYMSKLVEGGVLVFNTSNRYVRIDGVLAALARAKGYDCLTCRDVIHPLDHPERHAAYWIVLQRKLKSGDCRNGGPPIRLRLDSERTWLAWNGQPILDGGGKPLIEKRWHAPVPLPGPIWTDGYSNLLNADVMPWLAPWRASPTP